MRRSEMKMADIKIGPLCVLICSVIVPACSRSGYPRAEDGSLHASDGTLTDQPVSTALCPRLTSSPIEVDYVTSSSIAITWAPDQLGEEMSGVALWYGTDQEAVRARRDPARCWDSAHDPNLGLGYNPGPNTVSRTTIRGLAPETTYHIQLLAYQPDGCATATPLQQASTWPQPTEQLDLFIDRLPGGSSLLCLREAVDRDDQTNAVLELDVGRTECRRDWINMHLVDLSTLLPPIDSTTWQRATFNFRLLARDDHSRGQTIPYLEVSVASPTQSYYYASPRYIALPPSGTWEQIELPLAAFQNERGSPPSPATLPRLESVRVGAAFFSWATVQLDDIVVRY